MHIEGLLPANVYLVTLLSSEHSLMFNFPTPYTADYIVRHFVICPDYVTIHQLGWSQLVLESGAAEHNHL